MRGQVVSKFIASIDGVVDSSVLAIIRNKLEVVLNDYEITARSTELVVQETIPDCVKVYLVTRKIEGLSEGTLYQYAMRLRQFFEAVRKPIDTIDSNDVRVFLYNIQQRSGMSDRTLDGVRIVINSFFGWCETEGYIQKNPAKNIKPIKYQAKERGFLNEDELEQLRTACESERDRAMVEVLYSTACRVTELVNIKKTDIDLANSEIKVLGKGKKYRHVYINAKAKIAIQRYLMSRGDNSEYLFVAEIKPHGKISKRTVETRIGELGRNAGIERKVYPHLIRHTTATLGLKRGMPVTEIQKMLGHSNINTTLIYATVAQESVKDSHRKCVV